MLDDPALVAGKRVLDLGAGAGLVAIAAAMAGAASVRASEIDAFALDAIGMNMALNDVSLEVVPHDLMDGAADADVVLAGDVFYERPMAERALVFLRRAKAEGATVLIGDPKRTYLPVDLLEIAATYEVPVSRALEDTDVKRTRVWRLI